MKNEETKAYVAAGLGMTIEEFEQQTGGVWETVNEQNKKLAQQLDHGVELIAQELTEKYHKTEQLPKNYVITHKDTPTP